MIVVLGRPSVSIAAEPVVTTPDGRPVAWAEWLGENAPVAVLLWASWVPDAAATLDDFEAITAAAQKHDLEVIVVVVQESLAEAREALEGADIRWYHDRFGHLLKNHRVVAIPRMLVFSPEGTVIEQLEVKPESIRAWGGG